MSGSIKASVAIHTASETSSQQLRPRTPPPGCATPGSGTPSPPDDSPEGPCSTSSPFSLLQSTSTAAGKFKPTYHISRHNRKIQDWFIKGCKPVLNKQALRYYRTPEDVADNLSGPEHRALVQHHLKTSGQSLRQRGYSKSFLRQIKSSTLASLAPTRFTPHNAPRQVPGSEGIPNPKPDPTFNPDPNPNQPFPILTGTAPRPPTFNCPMTLTAIPYPPEAPGLHPPGPRPKHHPCFDQEAQEWVIYLLLDLGDLHPQHQGYPPGYRLRHLNLPLLEPRPQHRPSSNQGDSGTSHQPNTRPRRPPSILPG
ncbi:unnamed protein product, partial [Pleuronectes platessa]